MLGQAAEVMDRFNISHLLFYGSLLGQERDGELIPWTSDVDLLVPAGSLGKEAWEEREEEEQRRREEEEGFSAESGSNGNHQQDTQEGGDEEPQSRAREAKNAEARARVRARAEASEIEAKAAAEDEVEADRVGAKTNSKAGGKEGGRRRARRTMRTYTMSSPEVLAALRDRGLNYWREGDSTQMGRICPWRGSSQTRSVFAAFAEVDREDADMATKAGRYPDHFPYIDLYAAGIGSTDSGRTLQVTPREWSACSWIDNEYCYTSVPIEAVFPLRRCRIQSLSNAKGGSHAEGGARASSFVELNCPRKPADVLAILYGNGWRVPSKGVIGTDHQSEVSAGAAANDGAGSGGTKEGRQQQIKGSAGVAAGRGGSGGGGSGGSGGAHSEKNSGDAGVVDAVFGWVSSQIGWQDDSASEEKGVESRQQQRKKRRKHKMKGVGSYDILMLAAYVSAIVVVIYCAVPEACGSIGGGSNGQHRHHRGGTGLDDDDDTPSPSKRRGARGISSLSRGSLSSHGTRMLSLSGSLSGSMQGGYFGPGRLQSGYFW
jgi:hypothetical protein